MALTNYYNNKIIKKLRKQALEIDSLKDKIALLSDEELKEKTKYFKSLFYGVTDNKEIDKILKSITNEAFAICREASKRVINQFPYIVQIMGALAINNGDIAEMKTGEGKTLTETMAVYTNALTGRGVHIVTVNEYLAHRDAEWMGQIYRFLGLSVGCNLKDYDTFHKIRCYNCDITYTTNSELGFDYLRDNLANYKSQKVLVKGLNFCIIDECDSILIDEARTPLIISGGDNENAKYYIPCDLFAKSLIKNKHYEVDSKYKRAYLLKDGISYAERHFKIANLYDIENQPLLHCINNALKANFTMDKDIDYIVKDDKVEIVDENTGRVLIGRSFSDGIHQAIEAKENVTISSENTTVATITYQNFFRLYNKLSGMTGTAKTEEKEFLDTYNMQVISIPTNKEIKRIDDEDKVFINENEKYKAILEDVKQRHAKGQPILVGTISVSSSEKVYRMMMKNGLRPQLLNAKNDEKEAEIIALAGQKDAITIATNMAGRGTDIKLGEGVEALGGLAVIGTERHDSQRIDNQLRGRSGRQGDIGYSTFYVSLEDVIFTKTEAIKLSYDKKKINVTNDNLLNQINTIQRSIELRSFDARKHVLEYDNVLSLQREAIYSLKNKIIDTNNIEDIVKKVFYYYSIKLVDYCMENKMLDLVKLFKKANNLNIDLSKYQYIKNEDWVNALTDELFNKYLEAKKEILPSSVDNSFKNILLNKINHNWTVQLSKMASLQDGIYFRQYANNNPLVAYKEEGAKMFNEMMFNFSFEATYSFFMNIAHMLELKSVMIISNE